MGDPVPTIELIYADDCPNVEAARASLREALGRVGRELRWVERRTAERGVERYGSPTILVAGEDVAERVDAGACCRLYPSDRGLERAPSADAICAALARLDNHAGGLK